MFEDVLTISIKDDLERVSTEKKERKKKKNTFQRQHLYVGVFYNNNRKR